MINDRSPRVFYPGGKFSEGKAKRDRFLRLLEMEMEMEMCVGFWRGYI